MEAKKIPITKAEISNSGKVAAAWDWQERRITF
jgi:hypothetical protein